MFVKRFELWGIVNQGIVD